MKGYSRGIVRQALVVVITRAWSYNSNNNSIPWLSSAFVVGIAPSIRVSNEYHHHHHQQQQQQQTRSLVVSTSSFSAPTLQLLAKPKKAGSIVDSYQTVSVNCSKCQQRLFRYKKKNGTKSNLIKCYIERICEDSAGVLALAASKEQQEATATATATANRFSDDSFKRQQNDTTTTNGNKKNSKKKDRERKSESKSNTEKRPKAPSMESDTIGGVVPSQLDPGYSWECPGCRTQFARSSMIHGRPALKMVGGKIRMTKK